MKKALKSLCVLTAVAITAICGLAAANHTVMRAAADQTENAGSPQWNLMYSGSKMMYDNDWGDFSFYLTEDFALETGVPTQVKATLWYGGDPYYPDVVDLNFFEIYDRLDIDLTQTSRTNIPWNPEGVYGVGIYQEGSCLKTLVTGWQASGEYCLQMYFVEITEVWQYFSDTITNEEFGTASTLGGRSYYQSGSDSFIVQAYTDFSIYDRIYSTVFEYWDDYYYFNGGSQYSVTVERTQSQSITVESTTKTTLTTKISAGIEFPIPIGKINIGSSFEYASEESIGLHQTNFSSLTRSETRSYYLPDTGFYMFEYRATFKIYYVKVWITSGESRYIEEFYTFKYLPLQPKGTGCYRYWPNSTNGDLAYADSTWPGVYFI